MYGHRPDFYTFVFNEDIKVVQNFHGRNWEMDQIMFQSSYKDIFVVGVSCSIKIDEHVSI